MEVGLENLTWEWVARGFIPWNLVLFSLGLKLSFGDLSVQRYPDPFFPRD